MEGILLDNRYKIVKKLGAGGMAVVYLADDLIGRCKVAVKVMPPSGASVAEFVRRFKREFEVCSKLDHPNIIKLYSCGRTPSDSYYYAMEYLACEDLDEILAKRKKLRPALALQVVLQMARAFKHFHANNVVHRDLKPGNIMVEKNGRLVVMDFGLVHDPTMTQLTATGTIMGTPQYMSPELLMGEKVDPRSDIFQLGTIVHECLCGKKAFGGKTVPEVGAKILNGYYIPIREVSPDIPEVWQTFLLNCLGTKREDRYQSADEILADLQRIMTGQPIKLIGISSDSSPDMKGKGVAGKGTGLSSTQPEMYREQKGGLRGNTLVEGRKKGRRLVGQGLQATSTALNTSSLSKSSIAPETVKKGRRVMLAAFLGISLCVVMAVFLTGILKNSYSVKDLRIEAGVNSLSLDWKSDTEYPSQILLKDGKTERTIFGTKPGPTKEHKLVATDLKQDHSYTVAVQFPDGKRSLDKTVKTDRFLVELKSATVKNNGLNIVWESVPNGKTRLWLKAEGRTVGYEATAGSGNASSILIKPLPRLADEMIIETSLPAGGTVTAALSEVLLTQIQAAARILSSYKEEEFLQVARDAMQGRVAGHLTSKIMLQEPGESYAEFKKRKNAADDAFERERDKTRNDAREQIDSLIKKSDQFPAYKSIRSLSPLLFGTKLIRFSKKKEIFSDMLKLQQLYLYTAFEQSPIRSLSPMPDFADFALKESGLNQADVDEIELFPASSPQKVLNIRMKIPFAFATDTGTDKWSTRFSVKDPSSYEVAEIAFKVNDWSKIALWVNVNQFRALAYDRPIVKAGKTLRTRYQRIPIEALQKGENKLDLRIEAVYDRSCKKTIKVLDMRLRLKRKQ